MLRSLPLFILIPLLGACTRQLARPAGSSAAPPASSNNETSDAAELSLSPDGAKKESAEGAAQPAPILVEEASGADPASDSPPEPQPSESNTSAGAPSALLVEAEQTPAAIEYLIGPTKGLALEAKSPAGSWLSYCHFENEEFSDPRVAPAVSHISYIKLETRPGYLPQAGARLSAILRVSPGGQYFVALDEAGAPILVDTQNNSIRSLAEESPDLRHDGQADHRSFAFSDTHLALLREDQSLALLDLKKGEVQSLALEHPIWRIDPAKQGFILRSLFAGASHFEEGAPPQRCRREAQSFRAHQELLPFVKERTWRFERVQKSPSSHDYVIEEAPGYLAEFGDGWLRRMDDGALYWVEGKRQRRLTSSRCGGRIVFASESVERFLIACEEYRPEPDKKAKKGKPRYRFPVYFIAPGLVRGTKHEMAKTNLDEEVAPGHFVAFRPGSEYLLANLKNLSLQSLEGAKLLSYGELGVLIERDGQIYYLSEAGSQKLEIPLSAFAPSLSTWGSFASDRYLIRLPSKENPALVSRQFKGRPLALLEDGGLLVREGEKDRLIYVHAPDAATVALPAASVTPDARD